MSNCLELKFLRGVRSKGNWGVDPMAIRRSHASFPLWFRGTKNRGRTQNCMCKPLPLWIELGVSFFEGPILGEVFPTGNPKETIVTGCPLRATANQAARARFPIRVLNLTGPSKRTRTSRSMEGISLSVLHVKDSPSFFRAFGE